MHVLSARTASGAGAASPGCSCGSHHRPRHEPPEYEVRLLCWHWLSLVANRIVLWLCVKTFQCIGCARWRLAHGSRALRAAPGCSCPQRDPDRARQPRHHSCRPWRTAQHICGRFGWCLCCILWPRTMSPRWGHQSSRPRSPNTRRQSSVRANVLSIRRNTRCRRQHFAFVDRDASNPVAHRMVGSSAFKAAATRVRRRSRSKTRCYSGCGRHHGKCTLGAETRARGAWGQPPGRFLARNVRASARQDRVSAAADTFRVCFSIICHQ